MKLGHRVEVMTGGERAGLSKGQRPGGGWKEPSMDLECGRSVWIVKVDAHFSPPSRGGLSLPSNLGWPYHLPLLVGRWQA